jgi:hypothetical protein
MSRTARPIVVGIPTYQESANIARITRLVDTAVQRSPFRHECLIVNVDNHSPDGTSARFSSTPTTTDRRAVRSPAGTVGKGHNLRTLFELCVELNARAAVTVDADLHAVGHDWIERLAAPLLEPAPADMVVPVYPRRWYDGSQTNQIVAPLLRSETGHAIRQPIAGEYAFSAPFMRRVAAAEWTGDALVFGTDLFLVMAALAGAGIRQVALRTGKIHSWRSRTVGGVEQEFPAKFHQVNRMLFARLSVWPDSGALSALPVPTPPDTHPGPDDCDLTFMRRAARRLMARVGDTEEWHSLAGLVERDADDDAWGRVLNEVLDWSRKDALTGPQLEAFRAVFFARIAYVQPMLREMSQAQLDRHVWRIADAVRAQR